MTLHNWWLFVVAIVLLCGTPGPNMLHILSRSVDFGVARSVAAMAGCLCALIAVLAASAAGITTMLLAVPGAFDVLRYLGVAYLLYLGITAWRSGGTPVEGGEAPPPRVAAVLTSAQLFRGGFLISVSNPKLILFAAAFLPQFVTAGAPQGPQFAVLVVTFAAVESIWYGIYAFGGRSLARHLARAGTRRIFDRVTGGIFVAFALVLLRTRPA